MTRFPMRLPVPSFIDGGENERCFTEDRKGAKGATNKIEQEVTGGQVSNYPVGTRLHLVLWRWGTNTTPAANPARICTAAAPTRADDTPVPTA